MGERRQGGPPEDGREWIRASEAAKRMGLSRAGFSALARRWELTRHRSQQEPNAYWYLQEEVAECAEFRALRRDWRRRHALHPGKRYSEKIDLETARRLFISTQEAAALLGVRPITVRQMVQSGRLVCFQAKPGQRGSPLWFSRRSVQHLLEDKQRAKDQAEHIRALEREKKRLAWAGLREPQAIEPTGKARGPKLPEGWLTARQAAIRLGVTPQRVWEMGRIGRLRVQRLWKKNKMMRYQYYEEAQVEALLAEESYQKFRARYRATKEPEPETTVEQLDRLLKVIEAHREPPELPEPQWANDRYRY